jgi:hypothetical protein
MRFLMTISCLLFAACSAPPPPPPPASEAAKRDSIRLYIECLINAARSIDDGVSDALTVGNAIRPTCETEYRASMILQTQHLSPEVRARVLRDLMSDYSSQAVAAVLISRRRPTSRQTSSTR